MNDYVNIPAEMRLAKRWLLWRMSDGKKIPYYITGKMRGKGIGLDTKEDVERLAAFDEAVAASLNGGRYSGIGFALGPDGSGNCWQGIDLDKVDDNGLMSLVAKLPGYVEPSPSGRGFHAIGYGQHFKSLGSNGTGIEAYSGGRYFTVTGKYVRGSICDISEFVRTLQEHHTQPAVNLLIEGIEGTEGIYVPCTHSNHRKSQEVTAFTCKGEGGTDEALLHLPDYCKPTSFGQRHSIIFKLARHLKTKNPEASAFEMLPIVEEWFAQYLPKIGTKDWETTWGDFRKAWSNIRTLEGEGNVDILARSVDLDTMPPKELRSMGYKGASWASVQLCKLLSDNSTDGTFYLSSRTLERLFSIPQRTACNVIKYMEEDGITKMIAKAIPPKKAAVFRYVWPHPLDLGDGND